MNLKHFLKTDNQWASLALRVPVGLIFVAYGVQKLFGWLGGYGARASEEVLMMADPSYLLALLVGSAELFGGLALIIGWMVRPAAGLLAVMLAVVVTVMLSTNGMFLANGGYEFAFILFSSSIALTILGGGALSADRAVAITQS